MASARPNSSTYRYNPSPLRLMTMLASGLLLSGCMTTFNNNLFDQYEVLTGNAHHETVLTGFILGGAIADLAVLHIDENDNRRMQMYGFDGDTWVSILDATLRQEISFVDLANIGGNDRLITFGDGRLNWFEPETALEQELVSVSSNFNPPLTDEIHHVDITRDLNGDDLDDLVVPDVDGFWVFVQLADGTFADPVKVGPSTKMDRIYGADGYRYDPWAQSRVHEIDYNRDGRHDLAFWNDNHFEVHLQNEQGLFAAEAHTSTTEVAFDSDEISFLISGDMVGAVLDSLDDLNGDGIADMVVFKLEGQSISSKRSSYEVHFGIPTADGGTAFASEVGIRFQSEGSIQIGMDRRDLDGDGQVDLMFTTIDDRFLTSSFLKRWVGFWGDDIWLNLEFYHMEEGRYRDTPNAIHRVSLVRGPLIPGWVPLDLLLRGGMHESRKTQMRTIVLETGLAAFMEDWRRLSEVSSNSYPPAFNMISQIGDVTGDGHAELLIGKNTPDSLDVFFGAPGPDLFSRRSQGIPVRAPDDEEFTWLVDLNKDGKQDIIMHHSNCCIEANSQAVRQSPQVTLLIAR